MLRVGLDLGRKRASMFLSSTNAARSIVTAAPPDPDGLQHLVCGIGTVVGPVVVTVELMTGGRFVQDPPVLGLGCRDRGCPTTDRVGIHSEAPGDVLVRDTLRSASKAVAGKTFRCARTLGRIISDGAVRMSAESFDGATALIGSR